jgi:hypothetical protein
MSPAVGTWVLKIIEGEWLITVRPISGLNEPYYVAVFDDPVRAGGTTKKALYEKKLVFGVERALEDAASFIASAKRGTVDRARLAQIGRDMDSKPLTEVL